MCHAAYMHPTKTLELAQCFQQQVKVRLGYTICLSSMLEEIAYIGFAFVVSKL